MKKTHEDHLNQLYSEQPLDDVLESLEYLTNPSRGKHTTKGRLIKAYNNGTVGSMLRRLDPIAFETSKSDNL